MSITATTDADAARQPRPATSRNVWPVVDRLAWAATQPRLGSCSEAYPTKAPDPAWVSRFKEARADMAERTLHCLGGDEEAAAAIREAQATLEAGLLRAGGWTANHEAIEPVLARMLTEGFLLDGSRTTKRAGKHNRCHQNSAQAARAKPDELAMMTGYGLSADGMWRPHSWLVRKRTGRRPDILETTVGRLCYFGVMLDAAEVEDARLGYPSIDRLMGSAAERDRHRRSLETATAALRARLGCSA